MSNLTRSQKWALGSFVAVAAMMVVTFFMEGDVKTFGYIIISLAFAAFAVLMSGDKEKNKVS